MAGFDCVDKIDFEILYTARTGQKNNQGFSVGKYDKIQDIITHIFRDP